MTEPLLMYVDEAYKVLFDCYPPHEMRAWERMSWVMESWDGRKFDQDRQKETIARLALCQIGMHWHPSDGFPYTLELVTERLREFTPELGDCHIDGRVIRDTLYRILREHQVPVRHS